MTYTETDLVATIERLAGADLAALTQPQRDQLDQFHSGGSEAVDRLLPSLRLTAAMTVLDIGSGLGGPARQIAHSSGCTVVGLDITRRLRPGARFATFEVCLTGATQPTPPLPWSLDGTDGYLATANQLRDTIAASGFETLEWVDETQWILQWFENLGKRLASSASPATLPALLNDGPARMMNLAVALTTGVVSVHRGSFILAT